MSVLSKLQIVLHADTAAYQRNIKKAGDSTKKTLTDAQKSSNKLARNMGKDFDDVARSAKDASLSITNTISKITTAAKGAVAGFGLVELGRNVINAQREFDVLNAQLVTATGSMGGASAALKQLQIFAKETPYGLSQAVEGFAKLKNLGLTPSIDSLESFGNTASAMGKDLMQMIEAVADASTFEFERLKEFGIKASQEKNKVAFTFQGITTEVAKNAKEIEQYLLRIGEVQFAGAMATRMATLDGAISSLGDSWNAFLLSLGNAKIGDISFIDLATSAVRTMSDTLDFASEHINDMLLVAGGAMLYFGRTAIATGTAVAASWSASMARKAASTVAAATSTARLGNALMAIAQGHTVPQMAMHRLTVAIQAKTIASMAFIRQTPAHVAALKTTGAQALATARNFSVMTAAKNAGIASATLLGRGIMGVGSILSSVGRVIMAHPILTLSAIIGGIVVHVMGFEKAMESLSDAFAISKMMLGDLVDFALDGFVSMLDGAVGFLDGFFTSSEGTTTSVSGFFSGMFAGTQGGFVGLMQVAASAMDGIMAFARTACNYVGGAFGNLGTAIANVFKGVINFAASTFERGINNVIIKPINNVIEGFNKVSSLLGGGTIGTIGSVSVGRVDLGTYTPLKFDVASNNTGSVRSMVDDYVAAHNTAKFAARDAAQAANGAAAANNSVAKSAAEAAKGAGKNARANKDAADKARRNKEEQEKLTKILEDQRAEWAKLRFEMAHPLNLEIDKVNFEIEHGKFRVLTDDLKAQIRKEAKAMDVDIINDELYRLAHESTIANMALGNEGKFNELLGHLDDSRHKFSLLKDEVISFDENNNRVIKNVGALGFALDQLALADWHEFAHESGKVINDINNQMSVISAQGDLTKQLIEFEQEYQATLDKHANLREFEDKSAYSQIEWQANQVKLNRQKLATQIAYNNVLDALQDDESKRLGALQEQLSVIAKQHEMMTSMVGSQSPIDASAARVGVLNQALGLPAPEMNAFDALGVEHNSKLMTIQLFMEQQQELYKNNEDELTKIAEEGAAARAAVDRYYQEAKAQLLVTTLGEQAAATADGMKAAFGEQSKAYQAMFRLQQSWVIGSAILNIKKAISDAFANGVSWTDKIAKIALATSEGMKIITAIKQIRNPVVGQAHNGISHVPREGTWLLDKGERVVKPQDNDRLTKFLDNPNHFVRSEPKVIINNYTSEKADVQQMPNGDTMVIIGRMMKQVGRAEAQQVLREELGQNGLISRRLK